MERSEIETNVVEEIASRYPMPSVVCMAAFSVGFDSNPWVVHGTPMNESLRGLEADEYWGACLMLALIVDLMLQDEGVY